MAIRPGDTVTARDVASLLAGALGWEKSLQLVVDVARTMRFREEALQYQESIAILEQLGREQGIVGVAARFARARTDAPAAKASQARAPLVEAAQAARPTEAPPASVVGSREAIHVGPVGPGLPPRPGPVLSARTLAELLAHTLGLEKAEEALQASARRLALPPDKLDREQAARVFDDLSQKDGLVGIAARFAKAHMLLKFNAPS
jgi:hypothetical protein